LRENLIEGIEFICPGCRHGSDEGIVQASLKLDQVFNKEDDFVLEGFFICSNTDCGCKHPILNGVPIVLKNIKGWWNSEKSNLSAVTSDTPEMREYFAGLSHREPSSHAEKSLNSSYMDLHYGTFGDSTAPFTSWIDPKKFWEKAVGIAKPENDQIYHRSLDLGCSVGRYTFELARFSELSVGIDLKFSTVSEAALFQRTKKLSYERRKHGRCFEKIETAYSPSQNVLFMVADALDPPFRAETFDLVAALNLIDNVKLPLVLIGQMDALLKQGGSLILGSPYEWQTDICEPEEWLETDDMDSPEMLQSILEGNLFPQMALNYEMLEEIFDLPWLLRHHARHFSVFLVHLLKARKRMTKILNV
jgi:SAM-dependent methyltransferase